MILMRDTEKQEFTRRITQANRSQLLVILYEMTVCYIGDAEKALKDNSISDFHKQVSNIRNCINELMGTLDLKYRPSVQLLELYVYISRELIAADIHRDEEALGHIRMIIEKLRDAYAKASVSDGSAPLVDNARQVYAGLTYGRDRKNEDIVRPEGGCEFNA
mgnify:CR=1 FL=1